MIYSFKKLKELAHLPKEITPEDVAAAINTIGFEVEELIPFGNFKGLKFGTVVETYQNLNADKLTVCEIEFPDFRRTIQTTADNMETGMTVIAFVPGSMMGEIRITEKNLKGIKSEGMLTSIDELIGDKEGKLVREEEFDKITDYKDVVNLSIDPIEYLGLNDTLIDVDVLSNRSDANSYIVMAKELSAYFGTEEYTFKVEESNMISEVKAQNGLAESLVMIEARNDFTISIPEQILLAKSNIKSINDIVDLTNLTLLMTGQPTHAYDKDSVGMNFEAKKTSRTVEIFGGKEVELDKDLAIISDKKPVSVAGVIGLEETGVTKDTEAFILEFGIFNIKDVRKSVKTVKLNTDSSNQSSKIISKGTTKLAIDYISSRLNSFSEPINWHKDEAKIVEYSAVTTGMLAGFDIANTPKYTRTINKLETLGYKFLIDTVEVPSYRHDINHQQDIDEEIFRFYGYDNFKPIAPKMQGGLVADEVDYMSMIAPMGYQEVVTYSLISEEKNVFNPFKFEESIKLTTFVSKEREVIRDSLAHSLLEVVEYNIKRTMKNVSIFTKGMINDGISMIGLASTVKSFDEIKADLKNLIDLPISFERFDAKEVHSGVSALIKSGEDTIGWIGKLHPSINKTNAFVAEIKMPTNKNVYKFEQYDTSQLKKRDVTFALKNKEDIGSHIDDIRKLNVFSVKVVDEFRDGDILKSTVKVVANKDVIKEFDAKYNKQDSTM